MAAESDPVTRTSPTVGGGSDGSWPSVAQTLHQAKQLLQGPVQQQQQQLVDAGGNAQLRECLARLHEAVLLLQQENQQLAARVQQQQQQQHQHQMRALQRLRAPRKEEVTCRTQSLSPFATASEVSGTADGGSNTSSSANLPFTRALSGGVLPKPEVTLDEIRSAPNPSTPVLRGRDISVERFLNT